MQSAGKVLLETLQVARHLGRLTQRPVAKVVEKVAHITEEVAIWSLQKGPMQSVLGKESVDHIIEGYHSSKGVLMEYAGSASRVREAAAVQSCTQAANKALRHAGIEARVNGPFDEQWNMRRVIEALQNDCDIASQRMAQGFRLTPARAVSFMREAAARRRRVQLRDPIELYVEAVLASGRIASFGPSGNAFEMKLYMDVARLIVFAFDYALMESHGLMLPGLIDCEMRVKSRARFNAIPRVARSSKVSVDQVRSAVEAMIDTSADGAVPLPVPLQRHLLTNCAVVTLQLIETLTSDSHMQVSVLGHSLKVRMEPAGAAAPNSGEVDGESLSEQFNAVAAGKTSPENRVNQAAVDELVKALLAEPEINLVFLPDLLEEALYKHVLHLMVIIASEVLEHIQIRVFGTQVHLRLAPDHDHSSDTGESAVSVLSVTMDQLERHICRLQEESARINKELKSRRQEEEGVSRDASSATSGSASADVGAGAGADVEDDDQGFHALAAQDRLARSLRVQRLVDAPVEVTCRMLSKVEDYPLWMPWCTSAEILDEANPSSEGRSEFECQVGFGMDAGPLLGTIGDKVHYNMKVSEPVAKEELQNRRKARVVADTVDGFAFGQRLVYDWSFTEVDKGRTEVRLDLFFHARSVFQLPLWDSMQAMVTKGMMKSFIERADYLTPKELKTTSGDLQTTGSTSPPSSITAERRPSPPP